jgi:hypothetical protein
MKKYLLLLVLLFPFVAYGASVFQPFQGGTGNGSTPAYGNILVGNSSGTYTLTATSSLGLLSPVLGTQGQSVFMSATNTLSATSTIFITASSTVNIGTTTLQSIDPNHPAKFLIDIGNSNTEEGLEVIGSVNDFLESNVKNTSTGANAQACSTVTSNGGSNTTNFLSICANNTNFYNPQTYNVGGANDNSLMSLSSGGLYITQGTAGQKLFFLNGGVSTSTNIAMTISGTNVGIGTTSPSQALSLVGAIFASSTTATSTFFGKGINLITSAGDIPCFAVNGTCVTSGGGSSQWTTTGSNIYYNTGNVGIGNTNPTTTATTKLDVSGFINVDKFSGYRIDSGFLGYASSTNQSTIWGLFAGNNATSSSLSTLRNTAIGFKALSSVTGSLNTAVGTLALSGITTGTSNIAIGSLAGSAFTTIATGNIVIGAITQANSSSGGSRNIIIGSNSGNITSGSGNIGIGSSIDFPSATTDGQLNIGNGLFGRGMSNSGTEGLVIGTGVSFAISSSTPYSKFTIHSVNGDTFGNLFLIASSTSNSTTTLFGITNTGHFFGTSTSPILSSCGTAPSVLGSDSHGEVTIGSTATGCTITFASAYRSAPVCTVTNQSMSIVNAMTYTISTTTLTVSQTGLGGAKVDYICMEN